MLNCVPRRGCKRGTRIAPRLQGQLVDKTRSDSSHAANARGEGQENAAVTHPRSARFSVRMRVRGDVVSLVQRLATPRPRTTSAASSQTRRWPFRPRPSSTIPTSSARVDVCGFRRTAKSTTRALGATYTAAAAALCVVAAAPPRRAESGTLVTRLPRASAAPFASPLTALKSSRACEIPCVWSFRTRRSRTARSRPLRRRVS